MPALEDPTLENTASSGLAAPRHGQAASPTPDASDRPPHAPSQGLPAQSERAAEKVGSDSDLRTGIARWSKAAFVFLILAITVGVAGGAVHVVRPGETLAVIASKHDTTVAELVDVNGISDPDLILIGQRLTIPGSQQIHIVVVGDTVGEIAAAYDTSIAAIVAANTLRNANLIKIGQQLVIPETGTNSEDAPLYHVVQRGESLASIAARHGITVEALAATNGMRVDSIIFAGTRLRITPGPVFEQPSGSTTTHVVLAGESLGEIAGRYDTTVARLVELNDLANPNLIRVGQHLVVPGGGLVCPVPGASFFNDWGFPRSGGRFHQGNDLFAPAGTPVLAPVSGRVEHVDGTIGGLQFWLHGDDGNLYIGTHMSSFGASGRVGAGTIVGAVGDSGNARGSRPHLHFEVLIGAEKNINPYPLLVAACR